MPRGFLRSVISTIVLLGLLVVTIINVWQSNRIEKNQIELLNRIDAVEKAIENGDRLLRPVRPVRRHIRRVRAS